MAFGLVQGEDGQKIKSRSGDSVRLVELLDESKERYAPVGVLDYYAYWLPPNQHRCSVLYLFKGLGKRC